MDAMSCKQHSLSGTPTEQTASIGGNHGGHAVFPLGQLGLLALSGMVTASPTMVC